MARTGFAGRNQRPRPSRHRSSGGFLGLGELGPTVERARRGLLELPFACAAYAVTLPHVAGNGDLGLVDTVLLVSIKAGLDVKDASRNLAPSAGGALVALGPYLNPHFLLPCH